jgi:hypothetical protein
MFSYFKAHEAEFKSAIQIRPELRELAVSGTFLFQAAKDRLEELKTLKVGDGVIAGLLDRVKSESGFNFKDALDSYKVGSDEHGLLRLTGCVMSYFDGNLAKRKEFNERGGKPYIIAQVMPVILPKSWINYLLRFKLGEDVKSFRAPGIRNSILYLQDPENNISTMNDEWRGYILDVVFGSRGDVGVSTLMTGMKSIGIEAAHPFNNGLLCDGLLRIRPEIWEWDNSRKEE